MFCCLHSSSSSSSAKLAGGDKILQAIQGSFLLPLELPAVIEARHNDWADDAAGRGPWEVLKLLPRQEKPFPANDQEGLLQADGRNALHLFHAAAWC